jgi:hypothetical protein
VPPWLGQAGVMGEPLLDAETRAALRRAVFGLRCSERRRVFPAQVHVGDPDGERSTYTDDGDLLDDALRTDIVAAMLRQQPEARPSAVWISRVGVPEPHDLDLAWTRPCLAAFAEADETATWFAVITKRGWYTPLNGESATWQRLRMR